MLKYKNLQECLINGTFAGDKGGDSEFSGFFVAKDEKAEVETVEVFCAVEFVTAFCAAIAVALEKAEKGGKKERNG